MAGKALSGLLAVVGYLLSPLSWWNDAFINLPLAYLFSWPFTRFAESLFLPSFIAGYWLTNIAGLLLLHRGVRGLFSRPAAFDLKKQFLVSLAYTLLVVALGLLGWVKPPSSIREHGYRVVSEVP